MNKFIFYSILAFSGLLFSCSDDSYSVVEKETPTSGELKVFADIGLQKQLNLQAYTFQKRYERAHITMNYCSEGEAVNALFNDSCKAIAINRCLSKEEEEKFKAKNIYISASEICINAVVLIVNQDATDTTINSGTLKAILSGDTSIKAFKTIVFENEKSGTAKYCRDSLLLGKTLGKNCYAASDVHDLINKISTDKHAIGIVDYTWLSDSDDSLRKSWNNRIRILAVAKEGSSIAYYPDQSNIQTGDYPYTRHCYMVRRGQDFSLAAGFISYVAGPDGQIILLKTGLAPWRQPERMISVDMRPIQ